MEIIIKNKIRLKKAPDSLKKILVEKLTLPNPKWLENNRMGRWNKGIPPKIKFYRTFQKDIIIPRALARWLLLYCKKNEIDYQITDNRRTLPPVDFSFTGELKPFQEKATSAMLSKEFGTLNAPTGAGKTVIALYMIKERKQPATIIVHTKNLAFQWMDRIEQFLGIPASDIGLIGAGKTVIGEKVTVALVQSTYQRTEEISEKTGFLIVDECHRTPSRTFTDAVAAFDARYSLGLSATLYRRDNLSKLIFWHLGDTHYNIDKSQLVEKGDILSAEIVFRKTDFIPYVDPAKEYAKMLVELTTNDERNHLIVSDIYKETQNYPGVCLVLSDRKKHCENLNTLFHCRYKVPSAILTGDTGSQERETITRQLNDGQISVLFATGQLIGEGFDCKNLSTLFLATPVRFSGRLLQYLGRILRPAEGKEKARVFDYVDQHVDVLLKSAASRRNAYGKQVNITKDPFPIILDNPPEKTE